MACHSKPFRATSHQYIGSQRLEGPPPTTTATTTTVRLSINISQLSMSTGVASRLYGRRIGKSADASAWRRLREIKGSTMAEAAGRGNDSGDHHQASSQDGSNFSLTPLKNKAPGRRGQKRLRCSRAAGSTSDCEIAEKALGSAQSFRCRPSCVSSKFQRGAGTKRTGGGEGAATAVLKFVLWPNQPAPPSGGSH